MLFRKKIDRACDYCVYGTKNDDQQITCKMRGTVSPDDKCFRFKYDPCKRIPPKQKALDFEKYNNEDYSL